MLMLPFGTLWSEARPDDFVEVDIVKKTIVTRSGDVELDFVTRSSELLMELPLDSAFYLHSEIYAAHRKGCHLFRPTTKIWTSKCNTNVNFSKPYQVYSPYSFTVCVSLDCNEEFQVKNGSPKLLSILWKFILRPKLWRHCNFSVGWRQTNSNVVRILRSYAPGRRKLCKNCHLLNLGTPWGYNLLGQRCCRFWSCLLYWAGGESPSWMGKIVKW